MSFLQYHKRGKFYPVLALANLVGAIGEILAWEADFRGIDFVVQYDVPVSEDLSIELDERMCLRLTLVDLLDRSIQCAESNSTLQFILTISNLLDDDTQKDSEQRKQDLRFEIIYVGERCSWLDESQITQRLRNLKWEITQEWVEEGRDCLITLTQRVSATKSTNSMLLASDFGVSAPTQWLTTVEKFFLIVMKSKNKFFINNLAKNAKNCNITVIMVDDMSELADTMLSLKIGAKIIVAVDNNFQLANDLIEFHTKNYPKVKFTLIYFSSPSLHSNFLEHYAENEAKYGENCPAVLVVSKPCNPHKILLAFRLAIIETLGAPLKGNVLTKKRMEQMEAEPLYPPKRNELLRMKEEYPSDTNSRSGFSEISNHSSKSRDTPIGKSLLPIKVLIVDDNSLNRKIISAWLAELGIENNVACNGYEAVQLFSDPKNTYHVILKSNIKPITLFEDLVMPVMDGFQATREIRRIELERQLPEDLRDQDLANININCIPNFKRRTIIALTASFSDVNMEEARNSGFNDYLVKPVGLAMLEKKIIGWGSMQTLSDF